MKNLLVDIFARKHLRLQDLFAAFVDTSNFMFDFGRWIGLENIASN